jgi:hypothetical protein
MEFGWLSPWSLLSKFAFATELLPSFGKIKYVDGVAVAEEDELEVELDDELYELDEEVVDELVEEMDVEVDVLSSVVVSDVVEGSPLLPVSTSASAPAATANPTARSWKARKPPPGPPEM